jgi:hypothetical protein
VNFARSSSLFVKLGILFMVCGFRSHEVGLVGLFSIGLGFLLGMLSLFGVGRPADQPYKAPWISLTFGGLMILVVILGAVSTAFRGQVQADAPSTAPFIDQVNGFRLDSPGNGWTIVSPKDIRTINGGAAVGAKCGPNMVGCVFAETLDSEFRLAGHEQEVGNELIAQVEMDDKRTVFNRPDELDGQKVIRCQVVGKIAGRELRYEAVAIVANGRFYRLMAVGPSDQTSDDGLAFQPFMAAFHLLPTEPQAMPPGSEAPAARK